MNRSGRLVLFIFISLILHSLFIFITIPVAENVQISKQTVSVSLKRKTDMLSQPEVVVESVPESEEKPKLEKKLEEAVVKEVAVNDETISKQKSELIPEHVSAQSSTAQPETQSAASAAVLAPNAVEGNTQTELAENPFEGLIRRINSLKDSTYPLRAKKRGYQGTVVVELNLDREGRLIDVNIYQGCRHGILNDAALELIERVLSQPYRHYIGKEVQLRIPVTYKLL